MWSFPTTSTARLWKNRDWKESPVPVSASHSAFAHGLDAVARAPASSAPAASADPSPCYSAPQDPPSSWLPSPPRKTSFQHNPSPPQPFLFLFLFSPSRLSKEKLTHTSQYAHCKHMLHHIPRLPPHIPNIPKHRHPLLHIKTSLTTSKTKKSTTSDTIKT